jgi:2-succinyl-5-enolpyruvyl-6-hydroxy-3-cyclohexene-1-carboxylate synthase
MSAPVLHIAWAKLFLHAAACSGVRDVVVSPGSRSTPLALAAHESEELRSHFVVDERAAAFFALGQARVSGRPTLLVCTSGTAGAHYFPAVIEASLSGVPLVVVTADRPWELQQTGASQTIDQTRLFGGHVRHFAALGAPEPEAGALRALARTAAQAVARSLGPEPGPVHVNAPFRKPLEPGHDGAASEPLAREKWAIVWEAQMQTHPTRSIAPPVALDAASIDEVARLYENIERGLIVCGPAPAHPELDAYRKEIAALAHVMGFAVLAESTSQLRFGWAPPAGDDGSVVLSAFDALLRSRTFRRRFAPAAILELGAHPTSAGYAQLLAEYPACPRVVVAPFGWSDPTSTATILVRAPLHAFCRALRGRLEGHLGHGRSRAWSRSLAAEDARARAVIDAAIPATDLTEATVARAVIDACPSGSILALGNSSPVRDADLYGFASRKPLRVLHQRGASGIDGLVSGAAGAQRVDSGPVSLLLGDLSLLHDLTGLVLARAATGPLVITVVNNGGGRIFEQLPIGRVLGRSETFERCFATPQPIDFAAAAATFGLRFARAATAAQLRAGLAAAHAHPGATLIEAVVPPHDGAERARAIWSRIDDEQPLDEGAPGRAEPALRPSPHARKDEPS